MQKADGEENVSPVHQPALDELRRQLGGGRLNEAEFARCLRDAIHAAGAFEMTDQEAPLRALLVGNAEVDAAEAAAELESLEHLQEQSEADLYRLHLTFARVRRARVEGREQKSTVLAERGLVQAADLYRRAPDADRWWIAGAAAFLARLVGDQDAERRWWRYQLETLERDRGASDFSVLDPLELAAAADDLETMRLPGRARSTARIGKLRRLLELAADSEREGAILSSVGYLREAHEMLLDDPEWTPLSFRLECKLSHRLFELADVTDETSEKLEDALRFCDLARESAVLLGRCALACEVMASLVKQMHRHGLKQYWSRYEELVEYAGNLESLELLDTAFDLSVELLRRAQRKPVLGDVEPDRLEERIQRFILEHTPELRRLGADSMLHRWDVTLSNLTDTTKPLSIPQHLRQP